MNECNLLEIPPARASESVTQSVTTYCILPSADPTPEQVMRLAETSGALEFWNSTEEDIYSLDDGEPL